MSNSNVGGFAGPVAIGGFAWLGAEALVDAFLLGIVALITADVVCVCNILRNYSSNSHSLGLGHIFGRSYDTDYSAVFRRILRSTWWSFVD
jgi:hypothetical protein